jgi:hypothetical protein
MTRFCVRVPLGEAVELIVAACAETGCQTKCPFLQQVFSIFFF